MHYNFKAAEETGWFVAVAVGTVLAQAMIDFHPEEIADWRTWAVAIGAACVRAAGGALMAAWVKSR